MNTNRTFQDGRKGVFYVLGGGVTKPHPFRLDYNLTSQPYLEMFATTGPPKHFPE